MSIEIIKGTRRGTLVIVADGAEVALVEYQSRGARGASYVFYHPAPKHAAVILPNAAHLNTGNRRPVSVTERDAIPVMAAHLIKEGHLKPVAHWQQDAADRRAKVEASEANERARKRLRDAAPLLLAALKAMLAWGDLAAIEKATAAIRQAEEDTP